MERKKTKREIILDAALTLFSEKGFDATSIDEIGDAVGMKGPALYHYFKGKDDLFDSMIGYLGEYYDAHFGSVKNNGHFPESLDEFIAMSLQRLEFTIYDPQVTKARKVFAMEQFRNKKIAALTTKHHLTGIEEMNAVILKKLMRDGKVKEYDPKLLAFEFTSPVSMMVHLIDREPEKEGEAMERIRKHMEHFIRVYGI